MGILAGGHFPEGPLPDVQEFLEAAERVAVKADGVVADLVQEDRGGDGCCGGSPVGGDEAPDAAVLQIEFVGRRRPCGVCHLRMEIFCSGALRSCDELAIDVVGGGFAAARGCGADAGMGTCVICSGASEQASEFQSSHNAGRCAPRRRKPN